MDKGKLFLVIYLDITSIPSSDVAQYLYKVEEVIKFDESVMRLIVPIRGETRVECINPVLLDEEQYKAVEEKINELKEVVEEKLKEL